MRRGVAATGGVVLVLEACGVALIAWVLGLGVRHQSMSLDGLDPAVMVAGAWGGGGFLAVFLIVCGVLLGRAARRDRAPARFARILLIGCAVTHGVLGAVMVGLVGWPAFALLMVIMGLVVLALLLYAPEARPVDGADGYDGAAPTPTA